MKRRCDSRYFSHSFGDEHDLIKVAKQGLDAMQSLGATLVPTDTGNPFKQNFKFLRSGAGISDRRIETPCDGHAKKGEKKRRPTRESMFVLRPKLCSH